MPCFTHAEGIAVDEEYGDLVFFNRDAASEHWFPDYDKISLELEADQIDQVLHMLTAAETVARAFGEGVTISTSHPIAYGLDVEAPDSGEGFSPECHEIEFWVTRGAAGKVRWTTLNEYSSDKILTEWISREQLEAMKSGVVPQFN